MEPQRRLVEPFYFSGNRVGCLLIHGFSGSPSEMRWLGERLAKLGWTVHGILLSGHGTTPEEMAKTRWEDWAKDAEAGVKKLRKTCDTVIGIGLSMGGLLTLHLATLGLIDGIVTMNAPMVLADRRTRYAQLFRPFMAFVGKPKSHRVTSDPTSVRTSIPTSVSAVSAATSSAETATLSPSATMTTTTTTTTIPSPTLSSKSTISGTEEAPSLERFVYERIPVDGLISLNRGIRQVRSKLTAITCPALLMQSRADLTVNPISVQIIKKQIQHVNPIVQYWEKSGHILTLGREREEVALKVHEFLLQFVTQESR
ncbi:putative esterase/lipase [Desulfosporosinus sp. I2]|uniref:alpha/beta hydrolase n=1 Tax=Desulfosporosinus sp. I2 TaxID=1617025 RepID=UPI0005EE294A|nr:alpha/beta fold hydrolase [Desulfosporosinus sp. I2]KJR45907.1 putative esterase/lipase [Desulfosporosinus sp. I2]